MSTPPAASENTPRLDRGYFIFLCLSVGPPVGYLVLKLLHYAFAPSNLRPLVTIAADGRTWFAIYLFGGLFALAGALVLIFLEYRFGLRSLWAAIAASLVLPICLTVVFFLPDVLRLHRIPELSGVFMWSLGCVCAMTVCWLLARWVRVVR
jgi:hypothetical protein